ncbi:DUF5361 domain-containing protein [Mogibacterium diversum]|uniref:DUF5361 domain-containing protein n=1 Tax=Mogibacterium diversum TaxID=114527 RepID=UPI001FE6DB29|nr:DUF5361 domain-containing protein [Mogibacterium diversum]
MAAGLKDSSRIKTKVSGLVVSPDTFLLASIFDIVNLLLWSRTEDGEKGRNRPARISANMVSEFASEKINTHETLIFDSAEEFEAARERFRRDK